MNHFHVTSRDFTDGIPYIAKNLVDSPQHLVEGFRHLVEQIRLKATSTHELMRSEVECEYLLPGRGEFILSLSEADFTKISPSALDVIHAGLEDFFKKHSYFITDQNNRQRRLGEHQTRLQITFNSDKNLRRGQYYWGFTRTITFNSDPMTAHGKLLNYLEISIWEKRLLGEIFIPAHSTLEIGNRRDIDIHLALDALSPKDSRTLSGIRFSIVSLLESTTNNRRHLLTNKGKTLYLNHDITVRSGKSHLLENQQQIRFSQGSRPRVFIVFQTIA